MAKSSKQAASKRSARTRNASKGRRSASKKTAGAHAAEAGAAAAPPGEGHMVSILGEDGVLRGDCPVDDDTLLYLYRTMVEVREFDRRMLILQRQGRIGFYGPILGQEAATVGSVAGVEERDWIFPALREGAAAMMRGLPMHSAIAQLIGNDLDRCKGRQMPCHYTLKEGRYIAMSSVVGTQITHAVGAAMAAKTRGDDCVILGYLGDGATSTNDFHAGMNFAEVYRAPVILFCQNNQWAISVPVTQQHASETIAAKGKAYGMRSVRVDGNDVLAVYQVTREAAARARAGDGPTFVEAVTYRRLGHSSSDDPSRYRDDKEVEAWERRDPIERLRRYMQKRELWDDGKETALVDEIAASVNSAIREAEQGGTPAAETLLEDVFADIPPGLQDHFDRELPA